MSIPPANFSKLQHWISIRNGYTVENPFHVSSISVTCSACRRACYNLSCGEINMNLRAMNWVAAAWICLTWFDCQFIPHVRTHKGSRETVLSFLFCADAVREGGACTVIGRIHSHLSLPSIIRGCSYLSMKEDRKKEIRRFPSTCKAGKISKEMGAKSKRRFCPTKKHVDEIQLLRWKNHTLSSPYSSVL